jgi:hypothetical protein
MHLIHLLRLYKKSGVKPRLIGRENVNVIN